MQREVPSTLSKGAVNLASRNQHQTHEQRNQHNQLRQDLAATESEEDHPYNDNYYDDPLDEQDAKSKHQLDKIQMKIELK